MDVFTSDAIEEQLQKMHDEFANRDKKHQTSVSDFDMWYNKCDDIVKKAQQRIQHLDMLVDKLGKYPWHVNDISEAKESLYTAKAAVLVVARAVMETGVSAFIDHGNFHDFKMHWTSLELDYRNNAKRRTALAEQCQWLSGMANGILPALDKLETYEYTPLPESDDSSVLDAALEATCDTIKRNAAAEPPAKCASK
jgi:hypothetical protein